ncbi:MAG: metallophosphoesterase family protein [Bryobacterales bacterium]|nr:metallophosphoesterase family protein [Bryobacterales bacterium]
MSNTSTHLPRRLAVMGGSYGNLPALAACLADAAALHVDRKAFNGDSIGCCAHSNEVVAMIHREFDYFVAGNHEQQAVAGSTSCGCGYSSPEDEKIGCEAFEHAIAGLTDESRAILATWPDRQIVELEGGRVLLCHGSPGQTSEFLYEAELDDLRLEAWLDHFGVTGFVCTHSGLPFVRRLAGGRFAVNCGVTGKPDHDGDPAVHYAYLDLAAGSEPQIEIRRVVYDHESWASKMETIGIANVFVEPLRTGVWTSGVASLPASERFRWLRASTAKPGKLDWRPELLKPDVWRRTLADFRELGLVTDHEIEETLALLDPAFPFFGALRVADSIHLHIKVDRVDDLPFERIYALGTHAENDRPGYIKFPFPGGINLIFSSIPTSEEDQLTESPMPARPFVDHFGIDLRREIGLVRAIFEDTPAVARRAGWPTKSQGGSGRKVYCCHSTVAEKYWVYPPGEGSRWRRPLEFAYGPLQISQEMNGCDLRPIDPHHPEAGMLAACAAPAH